MSPEGATEPETPAKDEAKASTKEETESDSEAKADPDTAKPDTAKPDAAKPDAAKPDTDAAKSIPEQVFDVMASYGLSVTLLLLLFLLTLLGTLEQAERGLYAVQKDYFESFFVVARIGKVPLALPGGYLLMILLVVNLSLGGLVRIRKTRINAGVIVVHIGIAFLLLAGLLKFHYAQEGQLRLYEGMRSDEFVNPREFEVAIYDAAQEADVREYLIPEAQLERSSGESIKFTHPDVPFDLTLAGYLPVCRPDQGAAKVGRIVVDGLSLLPVASEEQGGAPGVYAAWGGLPNQRAILWGNALHPATVQVAGKMWAVDLRRKRYDLPFTIVLDEFTRELYPRTMIPKVFKSEITKIEDGVSQPLKISMNQPLRHGGYTLFQSSWGPQDAAPGQKLYSQFSVVKNPSDNWPLYACVVISIGLLMTYGQKLTGYVRAQAKRRAA